MLLEGGLRFQRVQHYEGETLVKNNVTFKCETKEYPLDVRMPAWFSVKSLERDFHPFYQCTVFLARDLVEEFNEDGLPHPGNWFYHAPESVLLNAVARPPPYEVRIQEDPKVSNNMRFEVERFLHLERNHLRNYSVSYGNRDFSFMVRSNGRVKLDFYLRNNSKTAGSQSEHPPISIKDAFEYDVRLMLDHGRSVKQVSISWVDLDLLDVHNVTAVAINVSVDT